MKKTKSSRNPWILFCMLLHFLNRTETLENKEQMFWMNTSTPEASSESICISESSSLRFFKSWEASIFDWNCTLVFARAFEVRTMLSAASKWAHWFKRVFSFLMLRSFRRVRHCDLRGSGLIYRHPFTEPDRTPLDYYWTNYIDFHQVYFNYIQHLFIFIIIN